MAWLDNIRNAMHPYDDDYIENEERAAEEEFSREPDAPAEDAFEEKQPRPVFSKREAKPQTGYSAPARGSRRRYPPRPLPPRAHGVRRSSSSPRKGAPPPALCRS